MGSFSWCYCDMGDIEKREYDTYTELLPTKEQRLITGRKDYPASVLFPEEFGGKIAQIDVPEYEDYGKFTYGGKTYDIYELVADWNREWIANHPDWIKPSDLRYAKRDSSYKPEPISAKSWYPFYSDLSLSKEEMMEEWKSAKPDDPKYGLYLEYRSIGIDIACYDDDNAALPYPIKIARNKYSVYEDCPPSYDDPYQGFDEEDGYYDFDEYNDEE